MKRTACALALLLGGALHASEDIQSGVAPTASQQEHPWFTGTLFAPIPSLLPAGYLDIEPYFPVEDFFGEYDAHWHAHSTSNTLIADPFLFLQAGITDRINFVAYPTVQYTRTRGRSSTRFGDLSMGFGFLLLEEPSSSWIPSIILFLGERFPTGKYQNLNPEKLDTDSSGGGVYASRAVLVFTYLFRLNNHKFLNLYLTLDDTFPSSTHVSGFNTYGGGFGTRGKVRTGHLFSTILSMEYSLTRHWALALDIENLYVGRERFSGKQGFDALGGRASTGHPSSDEINLAPAIEYNFNQNVGIIFGPTFSAIGRNTSQFAGAILAINFYFGAFNTKK